MYLNCENRFKQRAVPFVRANLKLILILVSNFFDNSTQRGIFASNTEYFRLEKSFFFLQLLIGCLTKHTAFKRTDMLMKFVSDPLIRVLAVQDTT